MSWSEWIRTVEIEPTLEACDPLRVGPQVEALLRTGCRLFGLALDGELAGLPLVSQLAPPVHRYGGALDVYLTGAAAPSACAAVAQAGGDSVTFQLEHVTDLDGLVRAAHAESLQAGVAFSASSAPEEVAARAGAANLVRCPGGELDEQLRCVRRLARALGPGVVIQAGGGIDYANVREYYDAGARVLLVGTAIFEREDLPRAYRRLVQALA